MKKKHISTSGSKSLIFYHFVFVTKYRRKVLNEDVILEITEIAKKTCDEFGGIFQEGNGEDDHYHLLVQLPSTVAPSKFVNFVKGRSSRILREKYWDIIKKKLWGKTFLEPILLLFVYRRGDARNRPPLRPATRTRRCR